MEQHNQRNVAPSPFANKGKQPLTHNTVLGITKGLRGQLLIFGEHLFAFVVSRSIILKDFSKKTETVIQREGRFRSITILAGRMVETKEEKYPLLMVGDSSLHPERNSLVVLISVRETQ